ncbi:MAG: L-serine ammonia-lyase, iron-sulfur-dependent subunit beta [Bacillota bacterium]|jgi:L-serine dehydratase
MSTRRRLSIFDVVGPVMIGPSSSHTAGAARLGKLARQLLAEQPRCARCTLYGSLAATYRGHGTDLALIGGLLGFDPDDERIRSSAELAEAEDLQVELIASQDNAGLLHPNLVRIELSGDTRQVSLVGASVGGGKVEVLELNGFPVRLRCEEYTLVVSSWDQPGVVTELTRYLTQAGANIGNMSVSRLGRGKSVVMTIELDAEPSADTLERLRAVSGVNRIICLQKL